MHFDSDTAGGSRRGARRRMLATGRSCA